MNQLDGKARRRPTLLIPFGFPFEASTPRHRRDQQKFDKIYGAAPSGWAIAFNRKRDDVPPTERETHEPTKNARRRVQFFLHPANSIVRVTASPLMRGKDGGLRRTLRMMLPAAGEGYAELWRPVAPLARKRAASWKVSLT